MDVFDWDSGNWPKCNKHGVSKTEIEYILSNTPSVRPDRAPQSSETRYNACGKTPKGRMVFIVFTLRYKNEVRAIRPISARYMHKKEVESYEKTKRN